MKALRICMVYQGFPPLLGGAEIYCHGLAKRLVGKGNRVLFLTAGVPGEPGRETVDGIEVRRIRTTRIPGVRFLLYSLGVLWNIMRNRKRIDIIHTNQLFTAGFIGALAGRLFKKPVIAREGTESIGFMKNAGNPLKLPFIRFAIRNTDEIYPNNPKVLNMLLKLGTDTSRVRTLWTPVDLDFFRPSGSRGNLRKGMGLERKFAVLFAGRLVPFKNVGCLIDSIPRMAGRIPSLMVIIAGYGPMEGDLKSRAERLGVLKYIRFTGRIPPEKIRECYQAADVLVHPALSDPSHPEIPFPATTVYQAMASGIPVVSAPDLQFSESGVPAVKTIREMDAGIGVNLRPEYIAEAVLKLYKSPALRKGLGLRGREIAERKLSWNRHMAEILKKYGRLASGAKPL